MTCIVEPEAQGLVKRMSNENRTDPGGNPTLAPEPAIAPELQDQARAIMESLEQEAKEVTAAGRTFTQDDAWRVFARFNVGVPGDIQARHAALESESDRGCALIGAAFLDEKLEALLRNFFIDDKKVADALLKPNSPLGAFSARIRMCRALGLLSREACRMLGFVRGIRNEFAHVSEDLTFETQKIRDPCVSMWGEALPPGGARQVFVRVVIAMAGRIDRACVEALATRRVTPPDEVRPSAEAAVFLEVQRLLQLDGPQASDEDDEVE
ncbi:hypothetical protein D7X96_05080 [Corallococcus interemptor]|uniref:DUF4145 domain-containing protein n=2 Tax=Corallococcus interemptor TaxID=2316720 RepID=A0A3A8QV41_9BACT|nr:hypothetical protein D7X96_05080 [Corallococcus interemptor]